MAQVVVTGGAGKLGRASSRSWLEHGWDVVVFDRARPLPGVGQRAGHTCSCRSTSPTTARCSTRCRGWRSATADPMRWCISPPIPAPGIVPDHQTFMNNMSSHLERGQRGPPGRRDQHRVGVERDRARAAVRHAAAVHPGGRGVRPPARVDLFAGQDARGGHGRSAVPLEPGAEDDRIAVLERDGTRRLCAIPVLRR